MVLDASAAVDLLLRIQPEADWVAALVVEARVLRAPHLLEVEVLSAVRQRTLRHELTPRSAERALQQLGDLRIQKYPATLLLGRMFQLRDALTAYDAAYVALAEALDAPLVTTDSRLARSRGHVATILTPPV